MACFSFERRDGVDVRFERVEETEPTMSDATKSKRKSSFGGWLQGVAAWFGERWAEEPGSVVLAVAALAWLALTVAKVFG